MGWVDRWGGLWWGGTFDLESRHGSQAFLVGDLRLGFEIGFTGGWPLVAVVDMFWGGES